MKTIVITGSSRGIGFGLAAEFLARGCNVLLSSRNPESLQHAMEQLSDAGKRVAALPCDVSDEDQVRALWDHAAGSFGRIDIWVNNAGVGHPTRNVWEIDADQAEEIIRTNLLGTMNNVRVVVKRMLVQGGGQIYNMEGFGSGGRVRKGLGIYAASKAAVASLNKTLAVELEGTPVKIASVQPGMVITDLVLDQFQDNPEGLEQVKPIFNIVASSVEEVCPVLAEKMLQDHKNGAHIAFMNQFNYLARFLTAPFARRNLFDKP